MVAAALALAACRGDRTDAPEVQTVVDTTSAPGALVTLAVPEPMGWNQEDTDRRSPSPTAPPRPSRGRASSW
jgi:hypothetical protein